MANKVILISNKTNSKSSRRDPSIQDGNLIPDVSAINSYVYMDIDMLSLYKLNYQVSLSSILQTDYVLGTEKKNLSSDFITIEGMTDEEKMKIWLYCKSSMLITKKIDNIVSKLKKQKLDPSKISLLIVDGHQVKIYNY